MSLAAHTARDVIAVERLAVTQSETGGQIRTYAAMNRGALPSLLRCRVQPLSAAERVAFGVRGVRLGWKLLFSTDPAITLLDRVTFVDADGQSHTASIVEPSTNIDGQSRLYRAIVAEVENER